MAVLAHAGGGRRAPVGGPETTRRSVQNALSLGLESSLCRTPMRSRALRVAAAGTVVAARLIPTAERPLGFRAARRLVGLGFCYRWRLTDRFVFSRRRFTSRLA